MTKESQPEKENTKIDNLEVAAEDSLQLSDITAVEVENAQEKPDVKTEIEEVSSERDRAQAELESFKQDTEERKKYAHRIFCLICCWIASVFILLILDGFGTFFGFVIAPSIVLAVIGSTTVNVLGIFYIVTHYLFPKR